MAKHELQLKTNNVNLVLILTLVVNLASKRAAHNFNLGMVTVLIDATRVFSVVTP